MADSKIVLPSSNAEEYSGIDLRTIISRIVNPKGTCVYHCSLAAGRRLFEFLVGKRNFYTSDNCPSWWPKDVAFTAPTGMVRSAQPNSRCLQNSCL